MMIPTTPAVLGDVATARPDHPFVIAADGELTYRRTAELAAALAAALAAKLGGTTGPVGILLTNGARWCVSYLAVHAAGRAVVPLNTWYRRDELDAVVRRAGIGLIITQDELFGQPTPAADLDVPTLVWNPGEDLGLPGVADPIAALRDAPTRPGDDALVLFTSGSSAEPKAVRLGQEGVVRTAHAIGERQGVTAEDRIWFGSPLFFVYGCSNALPNALTHGATLCVMERFDAAGALEFIERYRCTVFYGVAPLTRALAAHPDLAKRDISSLRRGTGNATPEDLRIAIEDLGISDICNAYGLTEGHGHSTITDHTDPPEVRIHTHGTVLPTQELRIVDGEIQIRGLITPGYLDTDLPRTEDGWFRTGDLGRLDDAGRLTYLGRSYELIKAKGINISPLEVELALVEHHAVQEAFVFGLPTPDGDEQVAAVLIAPGADVAEIGEWLRGRIAGYKVPTTVRLLTPDQLPLTATGKVSKRLMKDLLQ